MITKNRGAEIAFAYFVYGLVGFALGCGMQMMVPRSYRSGGKWAWLSLSAILAWAALETQMRNPSRLIGEIFGFPPHHAEAFFLILVTWPTTATWFYSVGVVIGKKRGEAAA